MKPVFVAMCVGVIVTLVAGPARAEENRRERGWDGRALITLSAGFQSAPGAFSYRDTQPLFEEEASAEARFKSKAALSYEVGAALRVAGDFGIGATITRFSEDQVSTSTLNLPHPLFYARNAAPAVTTPDAEAHVQRCRMEAMAQGWQVHAPVGTDWTIVVTDGPVELSEHPLGRTLYIHPCRDISEVLATIDENVQTVSVEPFERVWEVADALTGRARIVWWR